MLPYRALVRGHWLKSTHSPSKGPLHQLTPPTLYTLHTWRGLPTITAELHTDGWRVIGVLGEGLTTLPSLYFSKGTSINGPILMDFFKPGQLI